MKKVKEAMKAKGASDADVTAFEKGAAGYAKKIIGNFKDYEFFVGESMDPDGMVILLNYREDGTTPFITVSRHGLYSRLQDLCTNNFTGMEVRSHRDEGLEKAACASHL